MLETTWFLIWGILWAVYFMLDGFDLGAGMLWPFLGRGERDRASIHEAIGPFWDGNEVWLITAGGVTFAAFPGAYATLFSALYLPLFAILFGLIIRGAVIAFREEIADPAGRLLCDIGFFIGSLTPTFLFGVTFANLFHGVPINQEGVFQGGLQTLLNGYGLLGGALFLLLFLLHGALWIAVRTDGALYTRATRAARILWPVVAVVVLVFLAATARVTGLYANYLAHPALFAVLAAAAAGLVLARWFMAREAWRAAWGASCVLIAGTTLFGVIGMFPALVPSSLDPAWNVTTANSASSTLTLKIMLGVSLVFVPLVIAYQTWVHFLFREKVEGAGYGGE